MSTTSIFFVQLYYGPIGAQLVLGKFHITELVNIVSSIVDVLSSSYFGKLKLALLLKINKITSLLYTTIKFHHLLDSAAASTSISIL